MKFLAILIVMCAVIALAWSAGDCPLSSQMTSCSPKCKNDADCSGGTKCCPNICNQKSCSQPNKYGSGSGQKGPASSATGSYCGNAKCNSFEKCELDRTTKRQKCVRK